MSCVPMRPTNTYVRRSARTCDVQCVSTAINNTVLLQYRCSYDTYLPYFERTIVGSGNDNMRVFILLIITTGLLAKDDSDIVEIFKNASGIIENPGEILGNKYYNFTIVPYMGSTIHLETKEFNLKDPDKYDECEDFVRIQKIPRSNSEDKRFCGKQTFGKYLTADRITLLFKKKSNASTNAEFKIKYQACGSEMTEPNGTITTYQFRPSNDSKHLRCHFTIDPGTSHPIQLNIKNVTFNGNKNCTSHIQISNGENSNNTLCKSIVAESFLFDTGPINITYNGVGRVNGMKAAYTITSKENFSQLLQGRNGSFSPKLYDGKYVNNAEYIFNITSGTGGGKLIICFTEADLDSKCHDYVIISSNVMDVPTILCKENITSVHIQQRSTSAMVVFKTDFRGSGRGFTGFWSTCGGLLTETEGNIFPPSSCNPVLANLECQYEIDATGIEDVFITYQIWHGVNQNILSQQPNQSMWREGQSEKKEGKWIIKTNTSTIVQYLVSPRIYNTRTGTITLKSPMVDAIHPGKNCTFIINADDMDVIYFNITITTRHSNYSDDFVSIGFYPTQRTKHEVMAICYPSTVKTEWMSFGPVNITYVSVNDAHTPFKVHFQVEKGELLLPVIASAIGIVIIAFAVTIAIIKYRKKKKNATNELVWLTDKSTSTLERSFVPFLPELDKLSLNNDDQRGEIIVGLGGYAEVIFPEKKDKVNQEKPVLNSQTRKVSTFSLKRTSSLQVDTPTVPNDKNDEMRVKNEYSTPWDAKNEKDKIIKVMSLQYQGDTYNGDTENVQSSEFQYCHTSGTTFGIPCTEGMDNVNS
ncbi:hypothetical protein FSP39_017355 [Pinctada imbricata]|uniref:CUB domain-containing protein n=1 Tax=Pinctada imbricata TaxID=66713 RepID=A0AA89CCT4_PINIB|nr:hypothetical protein FSP39_017355 [Pinctada imbricata]